MGSGGGYLMIKYLIFQVFPIIQLSEINLKYLAIQYGHNQKTGSLTCCGSP